MARSGDALGYYYEEDYIEAGYYEYEPYIEEGYIDATYYQEEGAILQASAALSVSSTVLATVGVIKQGVCALSGVFSPTVFAVASRNGSTDMAAQIVFGAAANANRSADVTLENLVNLSLQAARIRDNLSALAASFAAATAASRTRDYSSSLAVSCEQAATGTRIKQLSATIDGVFSPTISAVASRNSSIDMAATATAAASATRIKPLDSNLNAVTTITATVGYLKAADADLSTNVAVDAKAISYQTKDDPTGRPRNLLNVTRHTDKVKWGTYSGTGGGTNNDDKPGLIIASNDFAFEGWVNVDGNDLAAKPIVRLNNQIELVVNSNLKLGARYRDNLGFIVDMPGEANALKGWTYWAIYRTNGVISFRIDSTVLGTSEYSGQIASNFVVSTALTLVDFDTGPMVVRHDTTTLKIGSGEITGNSVEPKQDYDNTRFYYTFDGTNAEDDILGPSYILNASANLNNTASITASLGGTFGTDAQLSTTAALNAVITSIEQNSAELSTAATLTAQATRIVQAESDLNGVFEQTASSGAIRRTAIAIQSLFTQNASINLIAGTSTSLTVNGTINSEITRIKQLSAQLDAFYSALTVAAKVGDFFVDADVQATVAVTATATRDATATGAVSTLLAAQAVRIQQLSSSLSSTADLTCTANLEIGAISALNTTSAVECSATIITDVASALITQATVDCTVSGFVGTLNNQLFTTATVDCDAGLIKPLSADLVAVDARVGAVATRIKQLDALIEGVFSPTISAVVSRNGSVDLAANSNIQIVNSRIRAQSADISVTSTAAATAGIIKGSAVLLAAATASVAVQAVVQASAAAEFTVAATVDALGIKAVEASAELNGVFSPTIVAVASRAGDIDFAASSTLAAQAVVIADSTAVFTVDCEQISSATLIKQLEAQLSMAVALTATSGLLKQTTADLNCTLQIQASGGFVDLLRFVYVVPKETRTHTIHQETKVHTVHKEQRIYTLGAP